jgi:hypothetical protein
MYRQHRIARVCATVVLSVLASTNAFADRARDIATMEARCEQERQARIKPLRDQEIAKCKAARNEASYCETFWRDYGNAVRNSTGGMTPRLFDDLPICVAAFEARKEFELNGK